MGDVEKTLIVNAPSVISLIRDVLLSLRHLRHISPIFLSAKTICKWSILSGEYMESLNDEQFVSLINIEQLTETFRSCWCIRELDLSDVG